MRRVVYYFAVALVAIAVFFGTKALIFPNNKVKNETKIEEAASKKEKNAKKSKKSKKNSSKNSEKSSVEAGEKTEASEEQNDKEPKEKTELEVLKEELKSVVKDVCPQVKLAMYMKNLDNGESFSYYDGEKKKNSASLIKLFIMLTAYDEENNGNIKITDDINENLTKMITESDNEASNKLIDAYGGFDKINKKISAFGFENTELLRKMHDKTPPEGPSGLENWTSVEDVGKLYEMIYNGELVSPEYSKKMLDLLKGQKRRTKIPAKITGKYSKITVANKTGELSTVENDAAIIMCDDFNLIFCVMINDIPKKADGNMDYDLKLKLQGAISDISLKLTEYYMNKTPKKE